MREKERIKPILEDLEKIWSSQPDLRLNQLLSILAKTYADYKPNDLFYFEDSDLEAAIQKFKKIRGIK
jgi:uncharacterized protein YihD (DUF1040 family)